MLGLSGAHRTGKTTLARAYAEATGVSFLQTSASGTFARMGLDPKVDYPLDVRLDIQEEILKDLGEAYAKASPPFVTDRTPIDLMAYTLADVQRTNVGPELDARLTSYIERCYDLANRTFPVILVVQPGIALKEEAGKAPAVQSYIEHIHSLIIGMVADERFHGSHYFIPRRYLDIERRLESCTYAMRRSMERHLSYVASRKESGNPIILH
jgi:hypothetical protein